MGGIDARTWFALSALALAALPGCGARSSPPPAEPGRLAITGASTAAYSDPPEHALAAKEPRSAADQQVERGAQLFAANCSTCHGASGGGSQLAPPLVGAGALPEKPRPSQQLRTTTFRTAEDVYRFVSTYMPRSSPGALPPDQYYAILAFVLRANGKKSDRALDASSLSSTELHGSSGRR
jgi:cytochrome c